MIILLKLKSCVVVWAELIRGQRSGVFLSIWLNFTQYYKSFFPFQLQHYQTVMRDSSDSEPLLDVDTFNNKIKPCLLLNIQTLIIVIFLCTENVQIGDPNAEVLSLLLK